jgi:hypothetical protein
MATKHWVRDVRLIDSGDYIAMGNNTRSNAVLYNFLRVAGWSHLWECDGEVGPHAVDPNHVQDGAVQQLGTTFWLPYSGGVVTKDATLVHSGVQSLKVVADTGEGVTTAALLTMTNPQAWTTDIGDTLNGPVGREMTYYDDGAFFGTNPWMVGSYLYTTGHGTANDGEFVITQLIDANRIKFDNPAGIPIAYVAGINYSIRSRYELDIWAACDVDFDVQVDQGDGVFVSVGTIYANANVFTRTELYFKRVSTGSSYVRLVALDDGAIYVGGVHVYRSMFEKRSMTKSGTDGILTNPDQFSTGGSFSPGASDVGQHLFVWDPSPIAGRNKNSGCYEIVADLGGGAVQLNLRSGSAALMSASGLRWRIADLRITVLPNSPMPTYQYSAGFGLQSPHVTKWRFFMRGNFRSGQSSKDTEMWSAPEDTDFNLSTGQFYMTGPSVQRSRCGTWMYTADLATNGARMHLWRGAYDYKTTDYVVRDFIMTDVDGSFFHFVQWDTDGDHGSHLHGYLADDPLFNVESFYLMARFESQSLYPEIGFDSSDYRFSNRGTGFTSDGAAIEAAIAQLGIGTTTGDDTEVETQSNAGPNPWSGKEWVRPLILWNDASMVEQAPAMQNADCGVFQTRSNMASLVTFDSAAYLHFISGLAWEWSGETIL